MKTILALTVLLALAVPLAAFDIQTDWAYHAAGDRERITEQVPGEEFTFLANWTEEVSTDDAVTLYVLTDHHFAGGEQEQVFARWWDGQRIHWIMGAWVQNIELAADPEDRRFRGEPGEGTVTLDLWRIQVPAAVTRPGDNFYAIQLRAERGEEVETRHLLRRTGGGFSRRNRLGQAWSATDEFEGLDWRITILP